MSKDFDAETSRFCCLELAANTAEINYDDDRPIGANADKILIAAQKFYDFVKGPDDTKISSDTIIHLHKN